MSFVKVRFILEICHKIVPSPIVRFYVTTVSFYCFNTKVQENRIIPDVGKIDKPNRVFGLLLNQNSQGLEGERLTIKETNKEINNQGNEQETEN